MADYRKMYLTLFNDVSKAIEILKEAQRKAEEIYIESDNLPILEINDANAEEEESN